MKKLMMKLTMVAILIASIVNIKAAELTFNIVNSDNLVTNLINGGATIRALTFVNGAAVAVNYAIFDAPATNVASGAAFQYSLWYSNGPTVTYSSYITNITRMYTNFYGATNSVTASNVLWTFPTTNVAHTNFYRLIAAGQAAASTTVVIPLYEPLPVVYGLSVTNSDATNSSWRINWSPAL